MPVAAGEVDFLRMMEHEFCGVEDADTEFETYNYGGLRTTLRQEWEYVVTFLCNPVIAFFVDTSVLAARNNLLSWILCPGFKDYWFRPGWTEPIILDPRLLALTHLTQTQL
jgi:hypothetical protein